MRHTCFVLLIVLASVHAMAQTPPPPPPAQTARQALLEMFLGNSSETFEKHLPESARHALIRKGDTITSSLMLRFASLGQELSSGGSKLETFDAGPTLAISEDSNGHHKIEILIERDDPRGDDDVIELSFRTYQDGQFEVLPVVPRLIFSLKQEKDVWRLHELTAEAHVPLSDPEYLNGLRKEQNKGYERMAPIQVQMLVSAELNYSQKHPAQGYTCKLSTLFGAKFNPNAADQGAALFDPALLEGRKDGYVFSATGCTGSPATKFQISAVPQEDNSGMKAFCADESGALRFAADGQADTCLSSGEAWK
jgi:hypothetical protein